MRNLLSHQKLTKILRFVGKWTRNVKFFVFGAPKRHIIAWNDVIWRIDRKNRCRSLGCRLKKEPKN